MPTESSTPPGAGRRDPRRDEPRRPGDLAAPGTDRLLARRRRDRLRVPPGRGRRRPDDPEARAAARKFRDVLGTFASGITVITTVSNGEPIGMTCQSFSSVSLDPPLVLFVPARSSRAWPVIQRTGRFCVNILAADQEHVSAQMATKGADKFAGLDWHPAEVTGSPVIDGSLAHLDCTIHTVHEGGDHYVVVGRVEHLETTDTEVERAAAVLPRPLPDDRQLRHAVAGTVRAMGDGRRGRPDRRRRVGRGRCCRASCRRRRVPTCSADGRDRVPGRARRRRVRAGAHRP